MKKMIGGAMNLNRTILKVAVSTVPVVLAAALMTPTAFADKPTPGYNTKIPESIMTPNDLETRIGTFRYFDGIPTKETAEAIYNHLDYIRGVESFGQRICAQSTQHRGCSS